jgi:protein TonB
MRYFYSLVLIFLFFIQVKAQDSTKVVKEEEEVFLVVEVMPAFPGGDKAMLDYLSKESKYPEFERDNGIQGEVVVFFIVEKDGSLSNVRVEKEGIPNLDAEAIRIVNAMPNWTPGTQRGEPVRVQINFPIRFTLR